MAAGAPVVATDIPGNTDAIISAENGWLVPVKSPQSLAKAVLTSLNNSDQSDLFAQKGQKRVVQEFTRQAMLEKLTLLYRLIASGQNLPDANQLLVKEAS